MEIIQYLIDFILHIDVHLVELLQKYENWIYLILFLIVFCETGLVVTPFLPGDSLLFAIGALAAVPESGINLFLIIGLLIVAAILGDSFNYFTGYKFGAKVFQKDYWFLKQDHLMQAQKFYEKYGGRTIIYARFIPIVRTFAPFVAGISKMQYNRFILFNVVGAFVWVMGFTLLGYLVGNAPIVKKNFTFLILAIIVISVLPPIWQMLKQKFARNDSNTL